jgi:hypothetical protein
LQCCQQRLQRFRSLHGSEREGRTGAYVRPLVRQHLGERRSVPLNLEIDHALQGRIRQEPVSRSGWRWLCGVLPRGLARRDQGDESYE